MRFLLERGVDRFVEIGTGKVLRGLLRSLDKGAAAWNVDDPESFEAARAALGGHAPATGGTHA
jgi:[acyl-carrier-protein] S-malonyltransferase